MTIKRIITLSLFVLLAAAVVNAQSLTELAKKEKERRAAVKGKTTGVVTNSDLAKLKKAPAVGTGEAEAGQVQPAAAGDAKAAAKPGQGQDQNAETQNPGMSEKDFKAKLGDYQDKVNKGQDLVDLLTLKMNALWQDFYSHGDPPSREQIQVQLNETYDKLTKSQADLAKAKNDLDDFKEKSRKDGIPQAWMR